MSTKEFDRIRSFFQKVDSTIKRISGITTGKSLIEFFTGSALRIVENTLRKCLYEYRKFLFLLPTAMVHSRLDFDFNKLRKLEDTTPDGSLRPKQ
jgi:hypothetical protein